MTTTTIERPRATRPATPVVRAEPRAARQWPWLVGGLVGAFAVPFVFTDLLSLERDIYYAVYTLFVALLCFAWMRVTHLDTRAVLLRNWRWGVALGVGCAAVLSLLVFRTEDATAHPDGLAFAGSILWRGLLYGITDGVLLSVFPILVVFEAFRRRPLLQRRRGKAAVGLLALVASLAFTAVYHVGYSDFRGEKLRKPVAGDVVWSMPTLLTLSPFGAPIAHAGLHVSAVVHSSDTDTFLPPHQASRPDLQSILDSITSGPRRLAPGATAYVVWPGGHWSGAAGVANAKSGQAMPRDARMRLESVSKIWTATLMMQLVDEQKVHLFDTLEQWLPGVFPFGDRITILQLLTHTSGLFDDNDAYNHPRRTFARIDDPALRARFVALAKKYEADPRLTIPALFFVKLAATQPLYFEPGQGYHYSNIGFNVLGLVVERATGQPIRRAFEQRIFRPLGLEQTAYNPQGPIRGQHPRGYFIRDGRLIDMTDAHSGKAGDGGIVSNAEETTQFLVGLMQGKLLSRQVLRGMKSYAFWNGGWRTPCGEIAWGHSGAGDGFKSEALVNEDGTRAVVLLLNGRGERTNIGAPAAAEQMFCASDP
jgi:D-alanyl-D-alanine carboxypeptidase